MTSPASTPAAARSSLPLIGVLSALVGLALLVLTVRQVGWGEIERGVGVVGLWFLVVVALGGLRFLIRAKSWILCASRIGAPGLGVGQAFGAVLAGDAVGNLTPLGLLGSEPTKVLLVRRALPTGPALTSVALDNGFHTVAVLVMIAAGAWVLVRQVATTPAIRLSAEVVLGGVLAAVIGGVLLALVRPAILSRLAQWAARLTGREARSSETLRDIEARFYGVFAWPVAALWQAAAWQVAFHAASIVEVWVILLALSGGTATFGQAFVLESAGRLIIVLFKVIPFRMGVDEASAAVVASALGIPASHGVALALVRKLRILVWNAIGLGVLARARR